MKRSLLLSTILTVLIVFGFCLSPCNSYARTYYDIDFSSPPHAVGQPPATGIPVTAPSSIVFGQPIVSTSFGALQDQPLVFNCRGNEPSFYYDQIFLSMDNGNGFYYTSFDIVTQNLIGSRNHFVVLFDTPTVQNITFQNDGQIDILYQKKIGYQDNQPMHFEILMNIANKRATIRINGSEVYNGSFGPRAEYLAGIRFSLGLLSSTSAPDYSSSVGIDNIFVADSIDPEPNQPEEPNEPTTETIDHPVAYWTFDEPNGLTVYDSVGVCDGELKNGATRTAGKFGNAIQFDGTTGYVEISDANDTAIEFNKNSSFTLSLWINPQESPQAGYFISKMRANRQGGVFGYWVGYGSSILGSHLNFTVESSYGSSSSAITPVDTAPVEHWYNVICVYDNSQIKVYVNGQLQAENTFTYNGGLAYPDKNLIIGAWGVDSSILQFFKGLIDDVRIYNYALNADEVTQLYQLEPTTENDIDHPVAHWKFDEESGTTAIDSAGICNGTLKNGATRMVGKFGNAIQFDGTTGYVEISDANDSVIEFNKNSSFSISLWAKPQADGWLFSKMGRRGSRGDFGYWAGYNATDRFYRFNADSSNIGGSYVDTDADTIPLDTWSHIVVVYNNTQMSIYRDGVLKDTTTFTYDTGTTVPISNMAIGAWLGVSYFKGLIDDFRVYNFALNADDIATLYSEGVEDLPILQSISIAGPITVAEESKTQYQVIGNFNDGSTEDITADVNLTIVRGGEYAGIDANGLLTTDRIYRPAESCTIQADYPPFSASKNVRINAICDGNQCTERQLLQRNINDTIELKQTVIKDLSLAIKIEKLTMQSIPRIAAKARPADRNKFNKISIKLLAALTEELWARKDINQSVGSLEEALEILNTRQVLQKSK